MKFKDLAQRVGTAAVALPVLLLVLFKGPPLLTVGVVAAAAAIGLWEFYGLLRARQIAPLRVTGYLALLAMFLPWAWPGLAGLPPLLPAVVALVIAAGLTRAGDIRSSMTSVAGTLLGAAYLGVLGGTLAGLRTVPPESVGPWAVCLLLAVVMVGDAAAYFAGSALGRHKLAPAVSPGKTWEGLLGGIAGGVAAALLVRATALETMPLVHAALLGVAITVAGTVGDLAESLMKRWAGVKDSGTLFPGHGGVLDRVDSLLFGAPLLYYYFLYSF